MTKQSFYSLHIPIATYRLQFNGNFRFVDAAEIIPYLKELGISDVYASPYFTACPGSTHGYDIIDPSNINPEIGTDDEFGLFLKALADHDMGQILDIVPNHMCIAGNNRYWLDILENGPASRYAKFFDIDWNPVKRELRNKVLLPILGDHYGNALENGVMSLVFKNGGFFIRVYDQAFPVLPETYADILLAGIDDECARGMPGTAYRTELMAVARNAQNLASYRDNDGEAISDRYKAIGSIKKKLDNLYTNHAGVRTLIEKNLGIFNGRAGDPRSFDLLDHLLSRQIYRLANWRVAAEEINYRRFFDINDLGAVRVEDPSVFEETHRLIFKLIEEKKITGLRVDHADGLYDPSGYFDRLQRRCFNIALRSCLEKVSEVELPYGERYINAEISRRYEEAIDAHSDFKPFYVVAEKILGNGETIPAEWPVFSSTGYVFLNSLNGLFVDTRNGKAFNRLYRTFARRYAGFAETLYQEKILVMEAAMSGEINTLGRRLNIMAEKNRHTRDFTLNILVRAIVEIIACFPVYRTYINGPDVKNRDRHYIEIAISRAIRKNRVVNESVFRFIRNVLLLSFPAGADDCEKQAWLDFTMRFQQITGPVMAKGMEDAAFYVYNRLISLNEVGGNPERFGTPVETFHGQNIERIKSWPYALITSSTHDTKRSEDVRARVNVLSEIPGEWGEHISAWAKMNRRKKIAVRNREVPDRNEEYLLYQTLLGTWPVCEMSPGEQTVYAGRIKNYMIKAVREAKINTSWINPDGMYEEALAIFVDSILDTRQPNLFLADLLSFQEKIKKYGMYNSCAQVLLKICSPGIPDFYQGTELWDLRLVDPDNRTQVDYGKRAAALRKMKEDITRKGLVEYANEISKNIDDGRIKMFILYKALAFRRNARHVFEEGDYVPFETTGIFAGHIIAFGRKLRNRLAIVAVPRFLAKIESLLAHGRGKSWADTAVIVPDIAAYRGYENVFTGEKLDPSELSGPYLRCSTLFRHFPVALLNTGF